MVPTTFFTPPPTATATTRANTPGLQTLKICAVTTADDARLVTQLCRRHMPPETTLLLGMIMWPRSRRSIREPEAKDIARIARASDMTPVGVFVDEGVETISTVCKTCGIPIAQLHGERARSAWASREPGGDDGLPSWIDVRDVEADSVSPATRPLHGGHPAWTIFDAKGGGTGTPFDWRAFTPPADPWLLAGGLDADNVAKAVQALRPTGLDVASGVAGPDKCAKDAHRLETFLVRAVEAYQN